MTSIRYYKDPRIIKLDGRYKHHPKFEYRIDFDTQGEKWARWIAVTDWCKHTWGREWEFVTSGPTPIHKYNDNYRTAISNRNHYFRHLYLRNEQDLTMMLLVIGA